MRRFATERGPLAIAVLGTLLRLGLALRDSIAIDRLFMPDDAYYTLTIAYPIKGTELYAETETKFIHPPDWAISTDRDIDFQRTYPRRYYDFAIRWVNNEVEFHRSLGRKKFARLPVLKLKSFAARGGMLLSRMF